MARIESLEEKDTQRVKLHDALDATFHTFKVCGETELQIDTYGSTSRQFAGKTSQSIQFGRHGIEALRAILANLK